jgi:hypothetical protein
MKNLVEHAGYRYLIKTPAGALNHVISAVNHAGIVNSTIPGTFLLP